MFRIFGPDYYKVCQSNSQRIKGRILCNVPLDPSNHNESEVTSQHESLNVCEKIQDSFVSASDSDGARIEESLIEDDPIIPDTLSSVDSNDPEYRVPDSEEQSNTDSNEYSAFHPYVSTYSSTDSLVDASAVKLKKTVKKNENLCYFCETSVLNFARHIFRNHASEKETQDILAHKVGSRDRKQLLTKLRKKGNCLQSEDMVKPMRRHANSKYLPCPNCFGFYSARNLWKHRKSCGSSSAGAKQTEAQNFLVRHLKIDFHLKEMVFPRMRPDNVSLVAKKDWLICAYAARYLKTHRGQHFVNVASRKMRELAKTLIELREMKIQAKTLFEALVPQNYDALVAVAKKVARYDIDKEFYEAPTFALNIGTAFKQCCDIALLQVLKRKEVAYTINAANAECDLKTLIQLIAANWRFDVSSQAASDLSIKKWNKVTLIPLASDLKLLKDYLIKTANTAVAMLEKNETDRKAYLALLESIFCRVILLNRKRPGELQRFHLRTYENSLNKESSTYEEFSEAVSDHEKELLKYFKRVVIRGKRDRGVPVLFSKDVQLHLTALLNYRNSVMRKPNIYLFGNPNTSEPVVGYKLLKKYAIASGAKNADAITCTKLRKHLATLTQLFAMSENDMEQLATFMGHTMGIHKSSYRLPDDIYQTAKISKLLLLMEEGKAGQFKGKRLDEITINLEEDLLSQKDADLEKSLEKELAYSDNRIESETDDTMEIEKENKRNVKIRNHIKIRGKETERAECSKKACKRVLCPWTNEQKKVVIDYFKKHISKKQPPKRFECDNLKQMHSELLANKDWLKIKVFIQNIYTKK